VLVVDDNATNRRVLALQTGKWGMTRATPNRRRSAALDRGGEPFDVAIVDMHMPEMDGRRAGPEATRASALPSRSCCGPRSAGAKRRTDELFDAYLGKPVPTNPSSFDTLVGLLAAATGAKTARAPAKAKLDPQMASRHPAANPAGGGQVVNQKLALRILRRWAIAPTSRRTASKPSSRSSGRRTMSC
jgi:CheY-like chemotaxis protein